MYARLRLKLIQCAKKPMKLEFLATVTEICRVCEDPMRCSSLKEQKSFGAWVTSSDMEPIHENVLNFVRQHCQINLAGNHDHALVEKMSMLHYQSYAIESILVAKGQLKRDHLDWLRSLPLKHTVEYAGVKILLTHAHPKDYEAWSYFSDDPTFDNLADGEEGKVALCFYGHTHQPKFNLASQGGVFQTPDSFTAYSYAEQKGETVVINVGSCGQPRDSDTRVSGVLLDSNRKISHFCVVNTQLKTLNERCEKWASRSS